MQSEFFVCDKWRRIDFIWLRRPCLPHSICNRTEVSICCYPTNQQTNIPQAVYSLVACGLAGAAGAVALYRGGT